MNICPICKARCFDDMEICYGCMHRFEGDANRVQAHIETVTAVEPLDAGASEDEVREIDEASQRCLRARHAQMQTPSIEVQVDKEDYAAAEALAQQYQLVIRLQPVISAS